MPGRVCRALLRKVVSPPTNSMLYIVLKLYFCILPLNYIFLLAPPRCAPGFYGNPMELGNSCKKCDCNGNSDPNLIFNECNNMTGQCLNCWGNTTGDNCERCAPGFYGDAISAKDCRGRCQQQYNTYLVISR